MSNNKNTLLLDSVLRQWTGLYIVSPTRNVDFIIVTGVEPVPTLKLQPLPYSAAPSCIWAKWPILSLIPSTMVLSRFRLRLEPPYLKDQYVRYSNGLYTWSWNAIEIPEAKPHDRLSIAVGQSSHQHSYSFVEGIDEEWCWDVPGCPWCLIASGS